MKELLEIAKKQKPSIEEFIKRQKEREKKYKRKDINLDFKYTI